MTLIRALELIETRARIVNAPRVELRVTENAPPSDIFVIEPGEAAHWLNEEDEGKIIIVVHPDIYEQAAPFIDYLLSGVEYESTSP